LAYFNPNFKHVIVSCLDELLALPYDANLLIA